MAAIESKVVIYDSIPASGQLILDIDYTREVFVITNVGPSRLEVYFNADGSGHPFAVLLGESSGGAEDGGTLSDSGYKGPVFLKSGDPANPARARVGTY